MNYESLIILSYVAAVVSVLFLIVGAVLFFKLKIKDVIGDLTGSKQRKAIESIKANNKSNVKKSLLTSSAVFETGRRSSVVTKKEKTVITATESNKKTNSDLYSHNDESVDDGVTEVLGVNAVDSVDECDAETSVLGVQPINDDNDNMTAVLGVQNVADDEDENVTSVLGVQMIDENQDFEDGITFVHGKIIK